MVAILFESCTLDPTSDLSQVPFSLRKTLLINFEIGLGTVTFSTSDINVVRGSQTDFGDSSTDAMYLGFGEDAEEFDTSRLIGLGYSLTTTYSSSTNVFTLICTKFNSPTLSYIFNISSWDIGVSKYVDGSKDTNYSTVLTWDDGD